VTELGGVLRSKDYYSYANKQLNCRWKNPVQKKKSKYGSQVSIVHEQSQEECSEVDEQSQEESRMRFPPGKYNNKRPPYRKPAKFGMKTAIPVPVIGFRRVKPDEEVMKKFLHKYGPLTAGKNFPLFYKTRVNVLCGVRDRTKK
jgi:hypothetical protein